jgi:hypothetical protein
MDKELTPLEALKELRSYCEDAYYNKIYDKDYQIIETALKDYEELKKLKLLPYPKVNDKEYRRSVIKRLQAFETIKNDLQLRVISQLEGNEIKRYIQYLPCFAKEIDFETFELLKEILDD